MIRKIASFAAGEWKRQFSDSKVYIVLICLIASIIMYMGNMPSLLRQSGEKVGILELFPLYWDEYTGVYFGAFLLLVCDIPSKGFGMRNHLLRMGRSAWFWGETLYITALTTSYLLFIWLVSNLLFLGRLTITVRSWSTVMKKNQFGTSMFWLEDQAYLTNGTPAGRFCQCFLLIWLCLFFLGIVSEALNTITSGMAGGAVCAAMLVVHITIMNLAGVGGYPEWLYFLSPITMTWAFAGKIGFHIWEGAFYYCIISGIALLAGRWAAGHADI